MAMAFMAPTPAPSVTETKVVETKPTFQRRWWHRSNRLDARPVIWSLQNRPKEWGWFTRDYTIRHIPSRHTFIVSGPAGLRGADCSCHTNTNGRFQLFQSWAFKRAVRAWDKTHMAPIREEQSRKIAEQFQSHFIK